MATPLPCSFSVPIRAQSASQSSFRKPDPGRGNRTSSNWWGPLFGWSAEPDYVNNSNAADAPQKKLDIPAPESEHCRPRSRFALGCFTEEKAKRMRRKDMESASFHDIMYHSAIASRLASDVSDRLEK
ncbi:hypothetical protein SLEP1_g44007 [Rubroshorea leprosula]|uniref:Uncharacterized protein n=1 Tax=Rubroshorea leprosula TaxID=152421 RepID=A0AAV5LFC7_9ROSI|nr:hypothetical protein SLEP1_g44007 [Rubroshorea leprosula]